MNQRKHKMFVKLKMDPLNAPEKFQNFRNWTKIKLLGVLSLKPQETWYSSKEVYRDLQTYFDYRGSVQAVHIALQRYHYQGLVRRRNYEGMHVIHKISEKGLKRFLFLARQYLPSMVSQYREDPAYFGAHASKIMGDVNQILQIYSQFLNVDMANRTVMFGDSIYTDDLDWGIIREGITICEGFDDKTKKKQCLTDIKKVRRTLEDQQRQYAKEQKSQAVKEAEAAQMTEQERWDAAWEGKM